MDVQKNRKIKLGKILSNAMDKTVVVEITRTIKDPVFKKYIKVRNKFMAHDEKNECNTGDEVEIIESRPLSKRKRWSVKRILRRDKMSEGAKQ